MAPDLPPNEDDSVYAHALIVPGKFQDDAVMSIVCAQLAKQSASKARIFIADALFGAKKHDWDQPEMKWEQKDFKDVFNFARLVPISASLYLPKIIYDFNNIMTIFVTQGA